MAKRKLEAPRVVDDRADRVYRALNTLEKGAGRDGFFIASPRRLSYMTEVPVPTVRKILNHFMDCSTLEACPTRPCHFRLLRLDLDHLAHLRDASRCAYKLAGKKSPVAWHHPENVHGVSGISPGDFNALMTRMMVDHPAPVEPGSSPSRPPRPSRPSRRRAPAPAPEPPGFGLPRSS